MKRSLCLFLLFFLFLLPSPSLSYQEEGASIEALFLEFFPEEGRLLGEQEVVFILADYRITADWMEILFGEEILRARGNVLFEGPDKIQGEEMEFYLSTMDGIIWEGELLERHFQLEALQFMFSSDRIVIVDGLYSPCPVGCDDLYLTASRFELSPDMKLTGYDIHFYLLGANVMYLPQYSGWIRQGRFYPRSPIPSVGYSIETGPYVDLHYKHWAGIDMIGDYKLLLSEVETYLRVDYSLGSYWNTSLRYSPYRQGFLVDYTGSQGLGLTLALQEGENLFLEEERKEKIDFWPSLSLRADRLSLPGPFYLSAFLGYEEIREGYDENKENIDYISRETWNLKLESSPLTLLGGPSWRGEIFGQQRFYGNEEELLEYILKNSLVWAFHPFLRLNLNHQLVGLEGSTPFAYDDPLPGETMPGLRVYENASLGGRTTIQRVGFTWNLGRGLVKYPTGDDFQYTQLQLGTDYRPFPSIRLTTHYRYRELEGIALLKDDEKDEENHLQQGILYTLRPQRLPGLRLNLTGDWSFLEEDWEEITLDMGTTYGRAADRFQFAVRTSYDILEESWDEDGLEMEFTVRTTKDIPYWEIGALATYDLLEEEWEEESLKLHLLFRNQRRMPYWELGLRNQYNLAEDRLENTRISLRRDSPCFYLKVEREIKDGEHVWDFSLGTRF